MLTAKTTRSRRSAVMQAIVEDLRSKTEELGLGLSAWDASGQLIATAPSGSAFCQMLEQTCRQCLSSRQELANFVLTREQPTRSTGPAGCCLLALPVLDHRRLIGAVVLDYPTREMLDEEHLARLCDAYQLDRQVMTDYARQACRFAAAEAPRLQRMFEIILRDRQAAQDASQALTSLSTNLASTYEELSLLYRISGSMKVSKRTRLFVQDICEDLLDVINVELAAAVVYDERTDLEEDIVVQAGGEDVSPAEIRLLAARHVVPQLQQENHSLLENHFRLEEDLHFGSGIRNVLAVPLQIESDAVGVLLAVNKFNADFDSYDAKLLGSIANQMSVFLANRRMYQEVEDLLMGVLYSLTESIDAKDPYTCGHSRRVSQIARRLAVGLNLPAERVQQVYLAGLLHDVGKIGIPEAILCKDGKLTDEEYEVIKQHPGIGARILQRIRNFKPIIAGVLHHHERIDGRGYPDGLAGQDIPLEGRILGLADSWDAMTSHRTYRGALSIDRAREEIQRCAGRQFDAGLVELFLAWDIEEFMLQLHRDPGKGSDLPFLNDGLSWPAA